MHRATVTFKSISPYSQSRFHETEKVDNEKPDDYEKRTWRGRMHVTRDGHVFIPPMSFKKSLDAAASFRSEKLEGNKKYTKRFLAGVLVPEGLTLPVKAADVEGEWLFVPVDGKVGGGKRVKRCFPMIPDWSGSVEFIVTDEAINKDVFSRHIEAAGMFVGIGRFRPERGGYYGRFEVSKVDWK